ncbi:hypothetical protein [Ensifer sp. SL37]|uniref:hypothetical protein n=1 Tax=Ensifer sp. SL37 TaxID=2995137 RepID=UPI002274B2A5|nr:hypothetical protein [Ensifer sp. SL37]MCY1746295.1 hypothetical protein [Ensifer sp. SL37]
MQAAAIETNLRYQMGVLRFLETRLESHLHLLEDCQTPGQAEDLFDVWCQFLQNAFVSYFREGTRMVEVGSTAMRKAAKRLHDDERLLVGNLAAGAVM